MSRTLFLTALAAALWMTGAASAVDYTWLGTTSDQWNDAANWNNGVPTVLDGYTNINAITSPAKEPNIPVGQTGRVAGLRVNNGSHLYVNGTLTTGSSSVGYAYVYAGGTLDVYGTLDITKNFYMAPDAGTAVVNVRPGGRIVPHSGTTLTLGQGAAANIGQMNIWGTVNFNALRWGYQNGTGRMTLYDNGTFTIPGDARTAFESYVTSGAVTSGTPAYAPGVLYVADPNTTTLRLVRTPKATQPSYQPALVTGNTVPLYGPSGTITLSWVKPLPGNPSLPVTGNVYFGLDDGSTLPQVAGGITANSLSVTVEKLKQYAWRVDSHDPNTGLTTSSDVWKFNTNNMTPTVTAEASPIWTWMTAGSLTLHAIAADDGYPAPSSLTYTWSQVGGTDVLPSPVTSQNVTLTFTNALNYNFQVLVSDGALTSAAYPVQVRVFVSGCGAAKDKSPSAVLPGDFNKDCTVNMLDLATFTGFWLRCTSADLVCP
jgi:hypothetical protein